MLLNGDLEFGVAEVPVWGTPEGTQGPLLLPTPGSVWLCLGYSQQWQNYS